MPLNEASGLPELSAAVAEHLHLLVAEWQPLADLGGGDVLLTLPAECMGEGAQRRPRPRTDLVIAGHVRPGTADTMFSEDLISRPTGPELSRILLESWGAPGVTVRRAVDIGELPGDHHVQVCTVTLALDGEPVGQLTLCTRRTEQRMPTHSELVYRETCLDLLRMCADCSWPSASAGQNTRRGNPRVGDGMIRLRADDVVEFLSPNAVSAVARLGGGESIVGSRLTDSVASARRPGEQVDETLAAVLRGRTADYAEAVHGSTTVMLRSIPLHDEMGRIGAVLFCRDVSELRRRERELSSKDATIRETHHRVKNSLQSVSALLRMQARRAELPELRRGLTEAMRRLEAISSVHETLSQAPDGPVDFDEHFTRQLSSIAQLAATGQQVELVSEGRFGQLPGHLVTPLSLVLNEILSNAVEHGLADRDGTVWITASRGVSAPDPAHPEPGEHLVVGIANDGHPLPAHLARGVWGAGMDRSAAPAAAGLGTRIVQNLVMGELAGQISWEERPGGGTRVHLEVPLRGLS